MEIDNINNHCFWCEDNNENHFVGIKINNSDYQIWLPHGCHIDKNPQITQKIVRNLLNTLIRFSNKNQGNIVFSYSNNESNNNLPLSSIIYILDYFFSHNCNFYTIKQFKNKLNGDGKINWKKTIKHVRACAQNKSIFYFDAIKKTIQSNIENTVTLINKFCVYECYKILGWIYPKLSIKKPRIFFNKSYFISILTQKILQTNNDLDKRLFIAMKDFISTITNDIFKNTRATIGTNSFHVVWESMINSMFSNQDVRQFYPSAKWTINFPSRQSSDASFLRPDSILKFNNEIIILDAKYYRFGCNNSIDFNLLPQTSDINKQITYGDYVWNKFKKCVNIRNAFIMPFNSKKNIFNISNNIINIGYAILDWQKQANSLAHQKIIAILIDTNYTLENYNNNNLDFSKLLYKEITRR